MGIIFDRKQGAFAHCRKPVMTFDQWRDKKPVNQAACVI